ncbi:unknown [Mycoplasma sp. CAG:776]|nr:unknown [Mycoplasma sp. CAG:776]
MNMEISVKKFGIVMVVLVLLELFLLFIFAPEKETLEYDATYCEEAVCNLDESLCYVYDLDQNGETIIVWKGTCKK